MGSSQGYEHEFAEFLVFQQLHTLDLNFGIGQLLKDDRKLKELPHFNQMKLMYCHLMAPFPGYDRNTSYEDHSDSNEEDVWTNFELEELYQQKRMGEDVPKVNKPQGSGGPDFNIQIYMGLEKQNIWYQDILHSVWMWSGKYLDVHYSLRGQEDKLPAVENKVCLDHPELLLFTSRWPIRALVHQYLKNMSEHYCASESRCSNKGTQEKKEVGLAKSKNVCIWHLLTAPLVHVPNITRRHIKLMKKYTQKRCKEAYGRSRLHPKCHQKIHIQVDEENASEESQEEWDQEQDLELDCLKDQPPLQHASAQLHSSKSIKRKEPPTVPEPPPKQYKTVKDVTLPKNANKLQKIVNLPGKAVVLHRPAATVASRITSGDRNQLFWFGGPKKVKASKTKPEKAHVTERYFQLSASMQH
ncbi:hypothetical protein BU17DRAFT_67254 [Hysterangium stoloniferum]|nr:hypothetical protein BU17DRAFT_67254 [Hysterangium stoloniferum]